MIKTYYFKTEDFVVSYNFNILIDFSYHIEYSILSFIGIKAFICEIICRELYHRNKRMM